MLLMNAKYRWPILVACRRCGVLRRRRASPRPRICSRTIYTDYGAVLAYIPLPHAGLGSTARGAEGTRALVSFYPAGVAEPDGCADALIGRLPC
jgi:hypothetical protein